MRYAHEGDVLARLEVDVSDTAVVERLQRLEEGLCEILDDKMGRSFGVAPVAVTRDVLVTWYGGRWFTPDWSNLGYGYSANLEAAVQLLTFPVPIRSFVSASTGGTWNGSTWVDPEPVLPADVQVANVEPDGRAWGLYHGSGFWTGVVHVLAIWDDQPALDVPADVREAMTFLVCDEYRIQQTSPAGGIGPDGLIMGARNPWTSTRVASVITRHRVESVIV